MSRIRCAPVLAAAALVASAALVVIASPAGATTVSDEASLRAAFSDPAETSITLTADITLTDCAAGQLTRPIGSVALTLSGAFTIRQTCTGARVLGGPDGVVQEPLIVNDATITGGNLVDTVNSVALGGGIHWRGVLTLNRVTVVDNSAAGTVWPAWGWGGGVMADHLIASQSTFSRNRALGGHAGGHGGGIVADFATITDSTITDNAATGGDEGNGQGGGVFGGQHIELIGTTVAGNVATETVSSAWPAVIGGVRAAMLDVINSTITSNVAEGATAYAGGVSASTLSIAYSTIVGNTAANGANVHFVPYLATEAASVFASVVGDPLGGGGNCAVDTSYRTTLFTSQGYNYATDDSCGLTAPGDVQSGPNPQLGPLANNGGPTPTLLPAITSPLLDRIPPDHCQDGAGAGVTTDQRGVTRPQGLGCDVGAVEQAGPASPPSPPLDPTLPGAAQVSNEVVLEPRFTG